MMTKNDSTRSQATRVLALKVPPLALTALAAALMYGLPGWVEFPRSGAWHGILCAVVLATGLAICFAGVGAFRQSRTTVDPRTPDAASSLVVGGIYRVTRNPMYLGFLMVLLALALYLGKLTAFVVLPLFVVYLNEFQIKPEESALRARFGSAFDSYVSRVRRWL
ncbi:methyltransferase family protein [Hydrogenophaga palleronii]|uniref:methyltransferase family protein n=1 Tax=Hydrogenophaga palleronii TaxID=65655 RepID=UPI000A835851|nr:isoprenylcysteine carboxylmethyltransferase family protein [Hydrogenophaga palleronii]